MDPNRRLRKLCRRYGLPPDEAAELLPLLQRARESRPEVRRWLETVVEAALATRAMKGRANEEAVDEADRRVLLAVAGLLHRWEPGDDSKAD
jgi:hypothetical protein